MRRRISPDNLTKIRITRVVVCLVCAYLVLVGRLFYIQVVHAHKYKQMAEAMTVRRTKLPARRGTIYDRKMNKLAVTVDACDIWVQPLKIKNKLEVATKLAPIIGWKREKLLGKLESERPFTYLMRRADVGTGEKVREAAIPGTGADRTFKRVYPGKELAAHIIGFTNIDGKGIEGLEKQYDDMLRGKDGVVVAEVDSDGRTIPGTVQKRIEPENGNDIVLTIDSTLQHSLEEALAEQFKLRKAAGASAVMMNPDTGEVLAIANMPTFDPNKVGESEGGDRRNRAVTDLYEPGSTLKTITACAALESKAITTDQLFHCRGAMKIGRRTIRCSLHGEFVGKGHGSCNVAKMLKYSCNLAAAGMGAAVGKQGLYEYEKAFGMYEAPGTGLPGEVSGWYSSWERWPDIQLANISFGQGIAVTPMQMTRAYCAVANGGRLMKPIVLKEIRGAAGKVEKAFYPQNMRTVISKETSAQVSQMLIGVVSDGTGKPAQVDGYKVAGKTGSAQKAVGGRYAPGKFVASFVGFLPVTDPKVVILVAVDEPKGIHWGASVAAPVFQEAARVAMWQMKIAPDAAPAKTSPIAGNGTDEAEKPDPDEPNRPRMGG